MQAISGDYTNLQTCIYFINPFHAKLLSPRYIPLCQRFPIWGTCTSSGKSALVMRFIRSQTIKVMKENFVTPDDNQQSCVVDRSQKQAQSSRYLGLLELNYQPTSWIVLLILDYIVLNNFACFHLVIITCTFHTKINLK